MNLFPYDSRFDFMRLRAYSLGVALMLLVIAVVAMGTRGFNFALDFTGGTGAELRFEQPVGPESELSFQKVRIIVKKAVDKAQQQRDIYDQEKRISHYFAKRHQHPFEQQPVADDKQQSDKQERCHAKPFVNKLVG